MYRHGTLLLDKVRIESIQEHEAGDGSCSLYVKMHSGTQHALKCKDVKMMQEVVEELTTYPPIVFE